ncbi:MAG: terpene cyclase/mutase family protein [Planctomycetes bacterium]|nr:terpene cyclase/mutase family protein [Planctomycetota bacterium]
MRVHHRPEFTPAVPAPPVAAGRALRAVFGLALGLGVLVSGGFAVLADDGVDGRVGPSEESKAAVERGLAYLARVQNRDGSWSCPVGYKLNEDYVGGKEQPHVGVTALACIALLAQGNTPDRGRYGENVARGLDYLLACSRGRGDGYITAFGTRMYEHAFCTLFLAETYGMSPRPDVREALKRSVGLIIRSQNPEGGWRYQPFARDADLSITVSTLQALRAARNAGLSVPKDVITSAMRYVKRCGTNTDGSFSYQALASHQTRTSFPLTAAGVTSLFSAGEYDAIEARRGLEYLRKSMGTMHMGSYHYYYGHYYAAQAIYQGGPRYWNDYYPRVRDEIVREQARLGDHWNDCVGPNYATAMACIILQVPNEYLPIFQR